MSPVEPKKLKKNNAIVTALTAFTACWFLQRKAMLLERSHVMQVVLATCFLLFLIEEVCSFSVRTRKSVLLPWGKVEPELGFCVEQQDSEKGLLDISIEILNTNAHFSENDMDTLGGKLHLSLAESELGRGLGSELWPASIAASILLRSPEFRKYLRGKDLLELGSGVGLAGLAAAEDCSKCTLTDNDEEVIKKFETSTFHLNNKRLGGGAKLFSKQMDWRDDHSDYASPVDIILGTDVAYYYFLLRPLMDTSRAFMKEHSSDSDDSTLLVFIGQANRKSLWELYKNFRDGCYNQLTDKKEPPWSGETKMLLFNLQMSTWESTENAGEVSNVDGVVPISVILHHPQGRLDFSIFKPFDHVATADDDENIMKTF